MTKNKQAYLSATWIGALLLSLSACATDSVDATVIKLETPSEITSGLAPILVSRSAADTTELYLVFNGLDAIKDEERVALTGNSALSASIEPGDYVVELIDKDGTVFLRTPLLTFKADHLNSLFVHGEIESIEHIYHSNPWLVGPVQKTLAAFGNGADQRVPGRLELCADSTGPCIELAANLEYGAFWAGEVDRGTYFRFAPNVKDADQMNIQSTGLGSHFATEPATNGFRFHGYYLSGWQASNDAGCDVGCGVAAELAEEVLTD